MRNEALAEAKLQFRQTQVAVASTVSKNMKGYPFGSVVPYMSDSDGKAYMYISDIAQHSRNLTLDSKLSLTIYDQASRGDQNESARITIVGDASIVADDQHDQLLERYIRLFPDAEAYKQAHGFKLWQVEVKRVRYIGGFGKIFWLEADEWLSEPAPWSFAESQGMVAHMNEDHQDAMALMLKHHHGISDDKVVMTDIVTDGCYLYSNDRNYFVPFASACVAKADARKQLVALTQEARAQAA